MKRISGVYKITNAVTGDFYIGSSKNVRQRWAHHKYPSTWKNCPNNTMYLDMQKYGLDNFDFQILAEVESEKLKETEQKFIETLKPTYNSNRANGWDCERYKEYKKEYMKSEKGKESRKKAVNKYYSQLCCYNNETMTLGALRTRFKRQGVEHPQIEAKKYIIKN